MIREGRASVTLRAGPRGQWLGDLCFPAAALTWAIFTVAARAWKVPPVRGTAIVAVLSAVVVVPVYLVLLTPRLAAAPLGEVLFHAVYQGVVVMVVALLAFTRAVASLGAATTAMITAAVPVADTLLASPILGETPSAFEVAGLVLVTAGMLTAVLTRPPEDGRR